ncbi:MAG: hypothetical protein K0R67_1714 [Paenibacillus sp.]|nr:hypothetical protein [Paenibacillus sp.]
MVYKSNFGQMIKKAMLCFLAFSIIIGGYIPGTSKAAVGDTTEYFFQDLEMNYPTTDPNWNPAGRGTTQFQYSEINPLGMVAIKGSNGVVTYRVPKVGDYVKFQFYVPQKGNYSLDLRTIKNIGGGIADVIVDGASIGEFDFYANPAVNIIGTESLAPSMTLSKGNHTLSFKIKGRSAGSYYYLYLYSLKLKLLEEIADPNSVLLQNSVQFDKNPTTQADVTVSMATYGNTLTGIYYDGSSLAQGTDYTATADSVTINQSFLASLPIGLVSLMFDFSGGTDPELAVQVLDSSLPPSTVSISPEYASFDKSGASQTGITVSMAVYNTTLLSVQNGAAVLASGTDYALINDAVIIHPSYLSSLQLGTSAIIFTFASGQTRTISITVTDSNPTMINMAINPGFEDDNDNNQIPDRWSFGKTGTGTWEWDAAVKRSGNKSVKLISPSVGDRAYFYQQYLTVKPGATYDFGAYYKTENMAGQPFIQLSWFTSDRKLIVAKKLDASKDAADWQQVLQRETAPSDATLVYISVQLITSTGTVWFDDVSFTQVVTDSSVNPMSVLFDKNPTVQANIPIAVTENGNDLIEIRNDSYVLRPNIDYTYANGTAELNKTYLTQLAAGKSELVFAFGAGADRRLQLQIVDSSGLLASGTTFDKKEGSGQSISVTLTGSANLQALRNENTTLQLGTDYTISGNIVTLTQGYLASLPTRSYIMYFEINESQTYSITITIIDSTTPLSINLLANSSFEMGTETPDSWVIGAGTTDWDNTQAKDGTKSIKLSTSNASQLSSVTQSYIPVIPGNAYQIEAYYLTVNVQGKVQMKLDWYSAPSAGGYLSSTIVDGLGQTADWRKLFHEQIAATEAEYVSVTFQLAEGAGAVWLDHARLINNNILRNPGFEAGGTAPDSWMTVPSANNTTIESDSIFSYAGQKSVKLVTQAVGDSAILLQTGIQIISEKLYNTLTRYKLHGAGKVTMELSWLDNQGAVLRKDEVTGSESSDWNQLAARLWAPKKAATLTVQLSLQGGPGIAQFDEAEVRQALIDSSGNLVPVTDVVDVTEPLIADEFWAKLPMIELQPPTDSVWTQPAIRNFFFGPTESGSRTYYSLKLPETIIARDSSIPVVSGALGAPIAIDAPLVIAGDIPGRPFMKEHAGYSAKYYPRRMHDYISTDYNLSYVLTGDEQFKNRAEELAGFLEFSQWKTDGTNEFTEMFYGEGSARANSPDKYVQHEEWAGGWDYLFDWQWTDGYAYKWDFHEPDHHVNSQIASALVNSYELYGNEQDLQMAKDFFYTQIPRYGFHSGVWNNKTYYWTEYNPTGSAAGNNTNDATDNVTGLIAGAAAKLGYYETDAELKPQLLEYARGLMWNLVREFETDGRWFYDGQENPLNPGRFSISHDSAVLLPVYTGLTYLYKAGVDVADIMDVFARVEHEYSKMWGLYQRKEYLKLAKVYDGTPAPDETLTFSTFAMVTGEDLSQARFQDFISEDFIVPETLDVRISKLLPPNGGETNWTTDPVDDVVLKVTPEQLAQGIIIPFTLTKENSYKISYDIRTKSNFNRAAAVNLDSAIFAWQVNGANDATFVKLTSGTSGDVLNSYTLPLSLDSTLNSVNFMSFGARLAFPFQDEVAAEVVQSPAPAAISYSHDNNWGNIQANRYIYSVQSLMPIQSGSPLGNDAYGAKGKLFGKTPGDYTELQFELYRPLEEYKVFAHYNTGRGRGKSVMSIDGIQQGQEYDLYIHTTTQTDIPRPALVEMGTRTLDKGAHSLRYTVSGQNPSASGAQTGIYEAIILESTTQAILDTTVPAWASGSAITATGLTQTGVTLTWPAATDNVGVTSYKLYKDTDSGAASDAKLIDTVTGSTYTYSVTGLTAGTAYTLSIQAGDEANNWSTTGLSVDITTASADSIGITVPVTQGDTNTGVTEDPDGVTLSEGAAQITQETTPDGQKVTVFNLDSGKLSEAFDLIKNKSAQVIRVALTGNDPIAKVSMSASIVSDAAESTPDAIVEIKSGDVSYHLPVKLFDLEAIAQELDAAPEDIKINVIIEKITGTSAQTIKDKAEQAGLGIIGEPIEFTITVEAGGKQSEVNNFGTTYVTRTLILMQTVNSADATAVAYDPITGEMSFVPAEFTSANGQTTVTIKRNSNSIYMIVQSPKTFGDVAKHWAKAEIELLASKLVIQGQTETSFEPESSITRAEFATLLVRALGLKGNKTAAKFADVKPSDWFVGTVGAAADAGLVEGVEEGIFLPNASISREQMAVMIARAVKAAGQSIEIGSNQAQILSAFNDRASISTWAQSAVAEAVQAGIIQGMTDTMFVPADNATRAHAAVMLKRLLQALKFIN